MKIKEDLCRRGFLKMTMSSELSNRILE